MFKSAVQALLKTFGYRLTRATPGIPNCGMANFFPLIKRFGFDPKHIVDVGANHGNWTREAVKHFPTAQYTLVEPQAALRAKVQDLFDAGFQVNWINAGVSDQPGVLPLYMPGPDNSSTFLQLPEAPGRSIPKVDVPVQTLNQIVAWSGRPVPDMVKIDAEGFDLKVLAGASELLGKTEIFLAEASVSEKNFPNTTLALLERMHDAGYRLIDITDMNRSPRFGLLWLVEFVFLREPSKLLDAATEY